MKALVKILGIVAVVFLVTSVAVFFYVKSEFPPEKIREIAKQELSTALNREASIENVSVNIWPLGLKVEGIHIANPKDSLFSEQPMLQIPEVVLSLDLSRLFAFQMTIKEIGLYDLQLNYEVAKTGKTNLDDLGPTKDPETREEKVKDSTALDLSKLELPGSLSLEKFVISNASVVYWDKKSGQKISLGSINQNVALELDKTLENVKVLGELKISEISFHDKKAGISKGNINILFKHNLSANVRAQSLDIKDIQVGFQNVLINVKGQVSEFLASSPKTNLSISSNEMKIADFLKEVPASLSPEISKLFAKGSAKFHLNVKGRVMPQPSVSGALSLNDIEMGHKDVSATLNSLNGDIQFSNTTVSISPLKFNVDKHPVSIQAKVTDLQKVPVVQSLQIVSKLDLAKIMELAEKYGLAPEGVELKGLINSNIQMSGKLDPQHPERMKLKGTIALDKIYAKAPGLNDPAYVSGKVQLSNTQIIKTLNVKTGPSDVSVRVDVKDFLAMAMPELAKGKKTKVSVNVSSRNLSIDRLMPPTSQEEYEEEVEAGELPEEFPQLPDLFAVVNVNLDKTVFKHMTMSKFRLNATLNNQILAGTINAMLYKGSLSQKFSADLSNPKNGTFKLSMDMNNVEANDLISNGNDNLVGDSFLFKKLRDLDNTIYGKMNAKINLQTFGTPRTLEQNLTGKIYNKLFDGKVVEGALIQSYNGGVSKVNKDLAFKEMFFKKWESTLEARDSKLLVKHMDMDKTPVGFVDVKGHIAFDGMLDLDIENHLTDKQSKAIFNTQSKLTMGYDVSAVPKTKVGRAKVYSKITGTLAEPKFFLDAKRMAKEASGQAVGNVKKVVRKQIQQQKKVVKKKIKEETTKAKKVVKKQTDKAKEKAKQETKKQKEELKDKAKNKLKSLF